MNSDMTLRSVISQVPLIYRIDVENPNPDQRPGQLHIQIGGKGHEVRYLYDFNKGEFLGASRSLQRELLGDPKVQAAIEKGQRVLGVSP